MEGDVGCEWVWRSQILDLLKGIGNSWYKNIVQRYQIFLFKLKESLLWKDFSAPKGVQYCSLSRNTRRAKLKMQAGKELHKAGSLPSFQPRRQQSDLGSSFLAGIQICIIPNEAVPEMLASYSRKLECIYAIAQALGSTSRHFFICYAGFSQNFKSSSRSWVQGLTFVQKAEPVLWKIDGIERKTVFLWHSLELLCAKDTVPPKAIQALTGIQIV